jgi:hypothetical protein
MVCFRSRCGIEGLGRLARTSEVVNVMDLVVGDDGQV